MCYYKIAELGNKEMIAAELDAVLLEVMLNNKHASLAALFGESEDVA